MGHFKLLILSHTSIGPDVKFVKVGTPPHPPTKLGTPFVFQVPNRLVGTQSTPYQIGWLGHPTLLVIPPDPLLGQCPNFGTLMTSLSGSGVFLCGRIF